MGADVTVILHGDYNEDKGILNKLYVSVVNLMVYKLRGVGATGASQALALVDFQRYSENFISKKTICITSLYKIM